MFRVGDSRELQAIVLALKQAEKGIRQDINKQTRAILGPAWKDALNKRAHTIAEKKILASSGQVLVGPDQITLKSAALTRSLSGGFGSEAGDARAVEFGAYTEAVNTYKTRSRKGKSYDVKRHTQRQLTRGNNNKGYVVYPARMEMGPRAAALWAQTAIRRFTQALEGKG